MKSGDVHANKNQEGRADKAHVASELENYYENIINSFLLKEQKITHKLECDQGLRTMTSQGTGD